jgi:CRISPR/Cas system CMR-associated protein Cmr3 (group 5 of RAMP superfamily)
MSAEKRPFGQVICDVKERFPSPQMFDLKKIKAVYQYNDKEAQHVLDHGVELGLFGQMGHLYCVKTKVDAPQGEHENAGD